MNILIFYSLYNLSHNIPWFDNLVVFIAGHFSYIVIFIAGIFLLFHHHILQSKNPWSVFVLKWKEIFLVFVSGFSAWVLAKILKTLIHTPRPFELFSDLKPLFLHGGMDSFPSGHATFFSALAVAIFVNHKKAGYVFIFFALLIGLARIIGGVHFPIDILAGFVIGTLVSLFVNKYFHKIFTARTPFTGE